MRSKSHVKVFMRTRPTARPYEGLKTQSKDAQTITVAFPKQDDCLINNQLESLTFKYDGVLENVSQDVVYNSCVHEAVDGALAGYNSTVFAYGQTGAGKTFTMSGDARNYSHRGIIPRALQHVFREVDLRSDRIYSISASYLEVYNESLRDLLAEDPAAADSLAILDDAATTVVRGLTKVPVSSEEEALRQFFLGEQARSTAQHALNNNSSRSHVLFTLHIEMRASAEAEERALLSKLHLVDLAGSERIKKTQAAAGAGDANYEQLRESSCINKSLSFLEQVVNALARGDAHVPFRQSKLTAALRDAIGGNSNTVMIANLWPEEAHLEECVSTLRFAARVRCLQADAQVNESADPLLALKKAERQIKELRQELAMRDMLSGRGRVVYEDLSDGERLELQQLVLRYLSGAADLDELPTDSLKRIRETYKAFKAVSSSWAAAAAQGDAARLSQHAASGAGAGDEEEAAGVGDVDTTTAGFCIGTAPLYARPPLSSPRHAAAHQAGGAAGPAGVNSSSSSPVPAGAYSGNSQHKQQQLQRQQLEQQPPAIPQSLGPSLETGKDFGADADRNALFSKYKHTVAQGLQQAEIVRQQQQLVAQLKQELKDGGAEVNAAKASIYTLTEQLESKQRAAAADPAGRSRMTGGEIVLDDEQYQVLQQLKAAKARYRTLFDCMREARSNCDAAIEGLAAAKEALLAGFEGWASQQHFQSQRQPTVDVAAAGAAGQIPAWRPIAAADTPVAGDDEELDPSEAFEKAELARKAAAAGDSSSAAFYAAKKHTSKLLGARQLNAPATRRPV